MKHYYALFSGGLDSTLATLLTMSQQQAIRLTPLFFRYGQKSEAEEAKAVFRLIPLLRGHLPNSSSILDDCRQFDIGGLFAWSDSPILKHNPTDTGRSPDVENRNMILIGCAASVIMADWKRGDEAPTRLIGGFKNEHYDTTKRFADAINRVFTAFERRICLDTPLIAPSQRGGSSPKRLAKLARDLGGLKLLKDSWSCYYPQSGEPCKCCRACQGRQRFFSEVGVRTAKKGHR